MLLELIESLINSGDAHFSNQLTTQYEDSYVLHRDETGLVIRRKARQMNIFMQQPATSLDNRSSENEPIAHHPRPIKSNRYTVYKQESFKVIA